MPVRGTHIAGEDPVIIVDIPAVVRTGEARYAGVDATYVYREDSPVVVAVANLQEIVTAKGCHPPPGALACDSIPVAMLKRPPFVFKAKDTWFSGAVLLNGDVDERGQIRPKRPVRRHQA